MYGIMAISGLSFLLVAVFTPLLIWTLRRLRLTQPIRAELPADHQAKRGTPLMAGLTLLIGIAISLQFRPGPLMLLLCVTFLLFSSVGFLDDLKKAFWQNPSGISGRMKLVLQFIFTGTILYVLLHSFGLTSDIALFQGYHLHLPVYLYMAVMLLFVVASANAINFTDGLDGLLINAAVPTYFFFFMISDKPEVRVERKQNRDDFRFHFLGIRTVLLVDLEVSHALSAQFSMQHNSYIMILQNRICSLEKHHNKKDLRFFYRVIKYLFYVDWPRQLNRKSRSHPRLAANLDRASA